MAKRIPKPSILNLSVEEENLAAIPFAVLERRVGKRIGKIEIKGAKTLPDGTEVEVLWQVQGNNELGLPTEQDLDIFVALGVLTFQSNFSKTVSFTGREIARILNIKQVHGKFYRRLKLAMDRFVPLRFRALTATDQQEEVKWLNVFQEASFSLNRAAGRCTGTITWTDKLIQSMDSGFFRLLDSGRYMQLDGITAKHLYRYLAVAFEKTDLVVMDARKMARENLGIFNLPVYLSRLMQTLEPTFEQLKRIGILGAYHVVNAEQWRIALHRHPGYVPERKYLLREQDSTSVDSLRAWCRAALLKTGFAAKTAESWCGMLDNTYELYQMQRAVRLVEEMKEEDVVPHVACSVVRRAMEAGIGTVEATGILDWCEIAVEVCRFKRNSGQRMRNLPGLLVKIARDEESRERLVPEESAEQYRRRFRERELVSQRHAEEEDERRQILEYEKFRQRLAASVFADLPAPQRDVMMREKSETLRQQGRYDRLTPEMRSQEAEVLVLQDLARKEAPPFEKWRLRLKAQQAVLPFASPVSVQTG